MRARLRSSASGGISIVLISLVSQEIGAATAVALFPLVGPFGAVMMRLLFSAVILLLIVRPRVRGRSAAAWRGVVGYGVVLAGMNCLYYVAIDLIPLGIAKTLEMLGPLALSVVLGRSWRSLVWAGIAFGGVVLLSWNEFGALTSALGVVAALIAAVLWAIYILFTRNVGRHFSGLDGFTLGMCVASVAATPLAYAYRGELHLSSVAVLTGLGVAVLSTLVPYGLDVVALRRLPAGLYSLLLAASPIAAMLGGLLILQQALTWTGVVGMIFVIAATIGAVRSGQRESPPLGSEAKASALT